MRIWTRLYSGFKCWSFRHSLQFLLLTCGMDKLYEFVTKNINEDAMVAILTTWLDWFCHGTNRPDKIPPLGGTEEDESALGVCCIISHSCWSYGNHIGVEFSYWNSCYFWLMYSTGDGVLGHMHWCMLVFFFFLIVNFNWVLKPYSSFHYLSGLCWFIQVIVFICFVYQYHITE